MTTTAGPGSVAGAFADLIDQSMRASRQFWAAVAGDPAGSIRQMAARGSALAAGARRQARGCNCDIPPPCWMPEQLGSLASHVCPGATATIRLRITNCGMSPREVTVEAAGPQGALVTVQPASVLLAPFTSGTVTATFRAPDQEGPPADLQLWVHGCRDHLLEWTVDVSGRGCSCTHEVEVADCPDLVHHWYDHFYCDRPCLGSAEHTGA